MIDFFHFQNCIMNYYGILVDSKTGKPVSGATVSKIFPGGTVTPVMQTSANGSFNFDTQEIDFQISFSAIGYYPVAIDAALVGASPGGVIDIEPGSAETLDPVVVSPRLKTGLGIAALLLLLYYATKK